MTLFLIGVTAIVLMASIAISPRIRTVEGFYKGSSENGSAPTLWTLVLSQVTTWIFARSLMTAAILGFYYGIAGASFEYFSAMLAIGVITVGYSSMGGLRASLRTDVLLGRPRNNKEIIFTCRMDFHSVYLNVCITWSICRIK